MLIGVLFTGYFIYSIKVASIRENEEIKNRIIIKEKKYECIDNGNPKLTLIIENGEEDKFYDYTGIYGYPNYLFRTDTKQKWTNEYTNNNFCILGSNTDIDYFSEELIDRKELGLKLRRQMELLAGDTSITNRKFFKQVRFFNLWFANEDMGTINLKLTEELQALILAIIKK